MLSFGGTSTLLQLIKIDAHKDKTRGTFFRLTWFVSCSNSHIVVTADVHICSSVAILWCTVNVNDCSCALCMCVCVIDTYASSQQTVSDALKCVNCKASTLLSLNDLENRLFYLQNNRLYILRRRVKYRAGNANGIPLYMFNCVCGTQWANAYHKRVCGKHLSLMLISHKSRCISVIAMKPYKTKSSIHTHETIKQFKWLQSSISISMLNILLQFVPKNTWRQSAKDCQQVRQNKKPLTWCIMIMAVLFA